MGFQYRGPAWRKQVMKDIHLKAIYCLCPFLIHSLFPGRCELSSFSLSVALMVYCTTGPKQRNKLTMDLNLYNFNSASLLPLNYFLRYFVTLRKGDTHSNTHCGSLFFSDLLPSSGPFPQKRATVFQLPFFSLMLRVLKIKKVLCCNYFNSP